MDRIIVDDREKTRLQQVFDRAYLGLKSQNFRYSCIRDRDGLTGQEFFNAAYRGDGGLKCAIGWLIGDKFYSPNFEGELLSDKTLKAISASGIETCAEDALASSFLNRLQRCHDNCKDRPDLMQSDLVALAQKYNLNIPGK